jgi:hypothetical protein
MVRDAADFVCGEAHNKKAMRIMAFKTELKGCRRMTRD